MISVDLYGLYRLKSNEARYEFESAKDIRQLILLLERASGIPAAELKQAVIFVNGIPIDKLGMYRAKLNGGDRISIISPASGG